MKSDLKKAQMIKKAMDALAKQALRDEEARALKGGGGLHDGGQTTGMWNE